MNQLQVSYSINGFKNLHLENFTAIKKTHNSWGPGKVILLSFLLFFTGLADVAAQNTFKAIIRDAESKEPLAGATAVVQGTSGGASADANGLVQIRSIGNGEQTILFTFLGYQTYSQKFVFPLEQIRPSEILLTPLEEEIEEVVVSATRSSRTIEDIPTRVETISAEELHEKITMQPANVKMILTESTGIQTQVTSAVSANASIRIQGLDGKYTQLLKDGFPLYAGYSGGLSIVQIPPLDLQRVEVIKGASSTLYGGGAIAGLINFVTKAPAEKRELSFLLNANNTKAIDISGFYSQKFEKTGVTVFASQNTQAAYDGDDDALSDIPEFTRYNLNPRVFFYLDTATTLSFGINSGFENRLGGDMKVIANKADPIHSYYERNKSNRVSSQLQFDKQFVNDRMLTFKNSVGYFDRSIETSQFLFSGKQVSSFSELSYLTRKVKSEWVLGGNLWTDHFEQTNATAFPLNNNLVVAGAFVQNSYKANEKLILETGLRSDITNQSDWLILPRISLLYKFTPKFLSRIGGGLGYKTPTIFSEEAEEKGFFNIQPMDFSKIHAEKSVGGNFDVNYKTTLFEVFTFSINQLFFYTRLNDPLVLSTGTLPNGNHEFVNVDGYLESKGLETNLKLGYDDLSFYGGYTLIDAKRHFDSASGINPLTAKHRLYMTLMYELEEKLRIGYELFYTGRQYLSDGESRPDYWVMGISAEYRFKHFSLFVNAENFTDVKQSNYEPVYTGTLQDPQFREIWAPIDGFVLNGGVKINVW